MKRTILYYLESHESGLINLNIISICSHSKKLKLKSIRVKNVIFSIDRIHIPISKVERLTNDNYKDLMNSMNEIPGFVV